MKIQLDYDNKTVSIEDNVDLGDFVDKIRKVLPDWREWKLETKTEIVWSNPRPIIIDDYPYWQRPYTWPTITVDGTGNGWSIGYDNNTKVQYELQ